MGERVVEDFDRMPGARFFPDARLNFAENLLRRTDDRPAHPVQGRERDGSQHLGPGALRWPSGVSRRRCARRASSPATVSPRSSRTFPRPSSPRSAPRRSAPSGRPARPTSACRACSTDSARSSPGCSSLPTAISTPARTHDSLAQVRQVLDSLPSVERRRRRPVRRRVASTWTACAAACCGASSSAPGPAEPRFEQLPFNHPLYILYSSGTTGVPKCIVHGAGGTLLQHLKEHQLHCDIKAGDRVFYFTTCGWMMWNWLVSALASEATLLLYDGSPFHPRRQRAVRLRRRGAA